MARFMQLASYKIRKPISIFSNNKNNLNAHFLQGTVLHLHTLSHFIHSYNNPAFEISTIFILTVQMRKEKRLCNFHNITQLVSTGVGS